MRLSPGENVHPFQMTGERRVLTRRVIDRLPVEFKRELDCLQEEVLPREDLFKQLMKNVGPMIVDAFSVQDNGVAILIVKDQGLLLRFAYPFRLSSDKKNLFPIAASSIAGEVFRARKGRIDNNVPKIRHLDIYERMNYERIYGKEKGSVKIQRMISAPLLLAGGECLGVIQGSRKGKSLEEAGPNFTPNDLLDLNDLSSWLAPYILKLIPPDF